MDAGELTREELQRWVANRFYYQECIPIKDAAILSNCPEVEVRREWIQRIVDHDGTAEGTGGIESWLRLGEALGVTREELVSERHVLPGGALRRRRLRELRAAAALDRGGRVVAHRAVRPGRDQGPARRARAPLPLDRPGRACSTSATGSCRRRAMREYALRLVVERCRTREQQERAVAALRFKTEVLWAQLEAIERGDTQPQAPA